MDITTTDDQQQIDLLSLMAQMDHHNHHYYNSTFHIDPSPQIDQFSSNINGTSAPPPSIYTYNPTANNAPHQSSSCAVTLMNPSYEMPSYTQEKMKTCRLASMREMIFGMAAMQPVQIDPEAVKAPKRRNVKISKDPQSMAARRRRERISERIRILQRLVPGGTKMDTASMLDEAVHYVNFLKKQVQSLANVDLFKDSCQPPPPSHMMVGAVLRHQVLN